MDVFITLVDQTSDTPGKFGCFGCAPWFNISGLTWEASSKGFQAVAGASNAETRCYFLSN